MSRTVLLRRKPLRTAYRRGVAFERTIKKDLEARGYFVLRSAGSHSPVDLVALRWDRDVLLVQCKAHGVLSPADRAVLDELETKTDGTAVLAAQERGGWSYSYLSGQEMQP